MAEACDAGEDVIGALGPGERLWAGVGLRDIGLDRLLEAPAAEYGEPALDQVQPGRTGRGEVQVELRTLEQPVLYQPVLWVFRLSSTRCTSRPVGTLRSTWSRKARNSVLR